MLLERPALAPLVTLALLTLLGAPARAQQSIPLSGTPQEVTIDLATGTMIRGPVVRPRAISTCVSLDNSDWSMFAGVDSGNCVVEWITQAVKSGGKSSLVTGFQFGYASKARDTNFGGPGGQVEIAFREGYVKGSVNAAGTTGTEVARFLFSGLPALSNCSAFNDPTILPALGTVTALLDRPICLPDGNVGWTWKFSDLGSDGNAKTFPLLGCIANCNSSGPDSLGMTDLIDRYLNDVYLDTIAIPGAPFAASTLMRIHEFPTVPGQSVSMNGSGVNPVILTSVLVPELSLPWSIRLDCTGATPNRAAIFRIGFTGVRPPVLTGFGELLVQLGGGVGQNLVVAPHNGAPVTLSLTIPKVTAFAGLSYGVQGLCGNTPSPYFSNALMQTIGTP